MMQWGHDITDKTSVIVVGAGIAGLSAAWRLQERGFAVTVLEMEAQPGGRMAERRVGSILYNTGARLVYPFGQDFNALIRDVGLEQALVPAHGLAAWCADDRGDYCLRLLPGPAGALASRLPWNERLRLLGYGSALLARRRTLSPDDLTSALAEDDVTLATHIARSVGRRFLDAYVDPLFRGTRSWNAEEISAAFFVSTLAHLIGERRVFGFRGGMGQVTGHLARLVSVRLNCCVRSVRRLHSGRCEVVYDGDAGPVTAESDVVLFATEGDRVGGLLRDAEPEESAFFSKVRYNRLGIVHHAVTGEVEPVVRFFRRDSGSRLSTYQQLPAMPAAGRQHAQLYCQLTPEAVDDAVAAGMTGDLDAFTRDHVRPLFPDIDVRSTEHLTQWISRKLPVPYPGYGHELQRFLAWQAGEKRSVYYCGDYLSQALVTGAVASAARAVSLVATHHQPDRCR